MLKIIKFLPLTFAAGEHGFVFFVPYLLMFLTLWQVVLPMRRKIKSDRALLAVAATRA